MRHGRAADFFFAGLGIVPVVLLLAGLPQAAVLVFVPLMLVACCFGMAEQLEDEGRRGEDATGARPGAPSRDAPELTYRRRNPRG